MSATEQDKAPAPLDPFGNEICLLFLKYGKCRYKKKCKKSHILPDKNVPIVQKMVPVELEKPTVKEGPKIAFTVKKSPYARPFTATVSSESSILRQISCQEQQPLPSESTLLGSSILQSDFTELKSNIHTNNQLQELKDVNTEAMDVDAQQPSAQNQVNVKKQRKSKTKRPPKVHARYLLSPLFKTIISADAGIVDQTASITGLYSKGPSNKAQNVNSVSSGARRKEHPTAKKYRFTTPEAAVSSNQSEVAEEKIENWYTTYKAHLEPETRRLMVMTKPTTMRQKNQLKTMRKHHWECKMEIEQQLKRQVPTTFSLKIVRSRIDWERIAPYVTLMIQAAFQLDIQNPHLPVIGTTLCTLLEHKDLSGLACEKLLTSWGLTEIDARRFTSHLWEVMVAAAGEATVRKGKGYSWRVRQLENNEEYKMIQSRLSLLNKALI
ncbi:hypothetical protein FBU30_002881 [Linnemannia zychae]|nr:hypothetical protein FBU30_002881 [Linnemannia zychae]